MIHVGDALEVLRTLDPESVQCCVTSPPYWGLRDYGTASWSGGDAGCDHRNGPLASSSSTLAGYTSPDVKLATGGMPYRDTCGKCGATRIDAQMGLERTPAEYVARMVAVFEEVRRVLRRDGTLWLNLGDSYNAYNGGAGPGSTLSKNQTEARPRLETGFGIRDRGLKPKDLCGIPWRMAFALQDAGWYLRSDIIWAKPNPMPESVTDRPTKSHEYVFLLSKSARYFYAADAIAEESVYKNGEGGHQRFGAPGGKAEVEYGQQVSGQIWNSDGTRNARTVWTIATSPYPDAHFATFPPEIPRRCILAGSRHGDTVLDPFAGAGTTGLVASRLGRQFVGIELNPTYAEMARRRIHDDAPLLSQEAS